MTNAVPVCTWQLSEKLASCMNKPEHRMIRELCARNVYARLGPQGRPVLHRRLVSAVFDALHEPISELINSGLPLSAVFAQVQRQFDLPDFFTLKQFYYWHEHYFAVGTSVAKKARTRLAQRAQEAAA